MAEQKVLTGDISKAAGYIHLARKLVKSATLKWVPLRKTLSDGTRLKVTKTSFGTHLMIHSPTGAVEQIFPLSFFSVPVEGQLGPEYYTLSVSGAFKRKTSLIDRIAILSDVLRGIAVSPTNVHISNFIDKTLLQYDRKGIFVQLVDTGKANRAIDADETRVAVAASLIDESGSTSYLQTYTPELELISEVDMTDLGLTFEPLAEAFKLIDDKVYFSEGTGVAWYDTVTEEVEQHEVDRVATLFDIYEGELYTLNGFDETLGYVVAVYTIEEDGEFTFNREFGTFGGPPIDENPIDGKLDFPSMEPYEFFNSTYYARSAIAVGKGGVYISEWSNPVVDDPRIDRVMRFTHAGEFIRDIFATQNFTPRQIRAMDIG